MFNLDPKKMQAVMKQMGMSQEDISASRVTIDKLDDTKIVIENPTVTKLKIQGQESFQISGEVREEFEERGIPEADIKTVMEKTGSSEEQAKKALEGTDGNLAEAILNLSE